VKYLRIVILLLLVAYIGLGANGGCNCSGALGKITGTVSSAVSENTRIPGATITATGGGKTYTTSTDDTGKYVVFVPAGTYSVTCSKPTFIDKTQENISVSSDAEKVVNFSLPTGIGGTTDPGVRGIEIIIATHPIGFDVRNINRRNSKLDIDKMLRNNPPVARNTSGDYKTFVGAISVFDTTPPMGTQGIRFYIGTSQNGPFILRSTGSDTSFLDLLSMSTNMLSNSVDGLEPNTTYYLLPSLYGTWGETVPAEGPYVISTPPELLLTEPVNNYTIPLGATEVTFRWSDLGEGYEYYGDVYAEDGERVYGFDSDTNSYTLLLASINPEPGNYLWRVVGEKIPTLPALANRQVPEINYLTISISYPRMIVVPQLPPD